MSPTTTTHHHHHLASCSQVMLGLPYDGRIDIWSLGCVMAELATGQVLFPVSGADTCVQAGAGGGGRLDGWGCVRAQLDVRSASLQAARVCTRRGAGCVGVCALQE